MLVSVLVALVAIALWFIGIIMISVKTYGIATFTLLLGVLILYAAHKIAKYEDDQHEIIIRTIRNIDNISKSTSAREKNNKQIVVHLNLEEVQNNVTIRVDPESKEIQVIKE